LGAIALSILTQPASQPQELCPRLKQSVTGMNIRPMTLSDLEFAATLTAHEGWLAETKEDFEGFLLYDPNGCFVAEENGERIGICVATAYGESGFLGELIVRNAARGRGVGTQLMQHAIAYLSRRGVRGIYLDGVEAAIPLYERLGFRKVCRSLRFSGRVRGARYLEVRAMTPTHLAAVAEMDHAAFGADRSFFLRRRLSLHPHLCRVLEAEGRVRGFVTGRARVDLISVGPWVVPSRLAQPDQLLQALAAEGDSLDLALGVLEVNARAVKTIQDLGLAQRPHPPWRMVLGSSASLGSSEEVYAIGSAAKG
jgi:ribosomal protein S18 acetylase RimI-like enzyme